ncbi:hypothetical protein FQA39_LY15234 [Lamprigera yunnana]|nr:hypothetical protein FQA39_LY15234 [Lamprigera yunnana]
MTLNVAYYNVWLDKFKYEDAECVFYEKKAKCPVTNKYQNNFSVDFEKRLSYLETIVFSVQKALDHVVEQVNRIEQTLTKPNTEPTVREVNQEKIECKDEAGIEGNRHIKNENKKSKKPVIAKSNVILDVKPWSDDTDMEAMVIAVKEIKTDGLLWGASKFVPLAYGIQKLQISCVVEDDLVSIDWLQEQIEQISEHVQSVDIAAFNKV